MRALVAAELLKLRTTRMQAGLLVATLFLASLAVVVNAPTASKDSTLSLEDPSALARLVGLSFAVPEVLMLLLGVLAFTQEFRYGTVSSTFLVSPQRPRVLTAKWLAVALASIPVSVITIVVAVGLSVPLIKARDGRLAAGTQLWQVIGAALLVLALYGVIGTAVGAVVRNQIVAVVGVLVWMLVVEQILISSYPAVGRWLPTGASFGLLQLGPLGSTKGALLAVPAAGALVVAYTAVAAAVAWVVTPKRDVL